MDTFSISLSISTFNIPMNRAIFFCLLVGLMHFLMPIIGNIMGFQIIRYLQINVNFLLGIILLFICFKIILDLIKKEDKIFELNIYNMILLSISVSLDSFSTGFGLNAITDNYFLTGFIFSICATSFTFLGFIIGKYSKERLGIYANIVGIIILLLMSIIHILR